MSKVIDFSKAAGAQPTDVDALLARRRNLVAELAAADREIKEHWLRAGDAMERACHALAETAISPGIREEARRLADDLADRAQRVERIAGNVG